MAEALAACNGDGDKDLGNDSSTVVEEAYRNLCDHYSRGCSFVSPCCGNVHPCRLCHDEHESHRIDRHAITKIICRKCGIRQSVANYCCNCGIQFGLYYFCAICNFYDDVNKGQFHCEKCGICRARGKENFFHCDKCGFCLALEKKENHTCRQNISKNNCPICFEDIHTSRDPAHVPRCGHVLHSTCFKSLMQKGLYQCPQCQTSLIDMKPNWDRLDAERESWVMPQQLRQFKVKIHCRDCTAEGETLYHLAGLKCCDCGSYNTVRCGSEEVPGVSTALLNRQRRGYRRRRSRHREERADLEKQLQASEQRVLDAEKRLSDMQLQLQEYEQKAVASEQRMWSAEKKIKEAEERAEHAVQAAEVAHRKAELAEENVAELERKLFETESDLEELLEYRELIQATQRMSLESPTSGSQCHSSDGSLNILAHSCNNSLNGFFISQDQQQEVDQRQQCAGDKLSMTSL